MNCLFCNQNLIPQSLKKSFSQEETIVLESHFFCRDCDVLFITDGDSITSYTIAFCFGEKKGCIFFDCCMETQRTDVILPKSFPTSYLRFNRLFSPKEAEKKLKTLLIMS